MTNLVQPFSVGYPRTLELNAQTPSSDNSVMRTVQKVFIAAKTALMAVAETFLNLAKIIANVGISLVNKVHSLVKREPKVEKQLTLMQKAQNLGSRALSGAKGLLSSSASKVASGATASVQFAKDHKKAIGATVALAGLGAAGYYGYQAYTKPDGSTAAMQAQFLANTAKTPNVLFETCTPKAASAPLFEASARDAVLANTAKTPNVLFETCTPKAASAPLFEASARNAAARGATPFVTLHAMSNVIRDVYSRFFQ